MKVTKISYQTIKYKILKLSTIRIGGIIKSTHMEIYYNLVYENS